MLCYVNLEAIKYFLTKSRVLCEMQTPFSFVATRHSVDVKIYQKNSFVSITFQELQLNNPNQN